MYPGRSVPRYIFINKVRYMLKMYSSLTIFTHIDKIVIGKSIPGVSVGVNVDVFLLLPLPLTCLIQDPGKESLREGLGWVLLGLVFFVIGRNLP